MSDAITVMSRCGRCCFRAKLLRSGVGRVSGAPHGIGKTAARELSLNGIASLEQVAHLARRKPPRPDM